MMLVRYPCFVKEIYLRVLQLLYMYNKYILQIQRSSQLFEQQNESNDKKYSFSCLFL